MVRAGNLLPVIVSVFELDYFIRLLFWYRSDRKNSTVKKAA